MLYRLWYKNDIKDILHKTVNLRNEFGKENDAAQLKTIKSEVMKRNSSYATKLSENIHLNGHNFNIPLSLSQSD